MNAKGQGGPYVCILPRAVPVQLAAAPAQNLSGNINSKKLLLFQAHNFAFRLIDFYRPRTYVRREVMFSQVCVCSGGGSQVSDFGGGGGT